MADFLPRPQTSVAPQQPHMSVMTTKDVMDIDKMLNQGKEGDKIRAYTAEIFAASPENIPASGEELGILKDATYETSMKIHDEYKEMLDTMRSQLHEANNRNNALHDEIKALRYEIEKQIEFRTRAQHVVHVRGEDKFFSNFLRSVMKLQLKWKIVNNISEMKLLMDTGGQLQKIIQMIADVYGRSNPALELLEEFHPQMDMKRIWNKSNFDRNEFFDKPWFHTPLREKFRLMITSLPKYLK